MFRETFETANAIKIPNIIPNSGKTAARRNRALGAITSLVGDMTWGIVQSMRASRAKGELGELSDRMLRDVGVRRNELGPAGLSPVDPRTALILSRLGQQNRR